MQRHSSSDDEANPVTRRMRNRVWAATASTVAAVVACAVVLAGAPHAIEANDYAVNMIMESVALDEKPASASVDSADASAGSQVQRETDQIPVKYDEDGAAFEQGVALVKLADAVDSEMLSKAIANTGFAADASISQDEANRGLARIELACGVDEKDAISAFESVAGVEFSQPDYVYYLEDELAGATATDEIGVASASESESESDESQLDDIELEKLGELDDNYKDRRVTSTALRRQKLGSM